jgi:hypothetical protein
MDEEVELGVEQQPSSSRVLASTTHPLTVSIRRDRGLWPTHIVTKDAGEQCIDLPSSASSSIGDP